MVHYPKNPSRKTGIKMLINHRKIKKPIESILINGVLSKLLSGYGILVNCELDNIF